jgi:hypothetical protein
VTDRKAAAEEPRLAPTAEKVLVSKSDEKEASLAVETQHLDQESIALLPRSDADSATEAANQQLALLEVSSEHQSGHECCWMRQFMKTFFPLFLNAQIESITPTSTPPSTPPPIAAHRNSAGWGWFSGFEGGIEGCVPCFEGSPYGARGLL